MTDAELSAREMALKRCDEQVVWYDGRSAGAWRFFIVFQSLAITLGAATPVLILWSSVPKPVQALPAALASVAAAFVGTFRWLDAKTRFGYTREALKSERMLFETRTPPYGHDLPEEEALARFVLRIEQIAMAETEEWRTAMIRPGPQR